MVVPSPCVVPSDVRSVYVLYGGIAAHYMESCVYGSPLLYTASQQQQLACTPTTLAVAFHAFSRCAYQRATSAVTQGCCPCRRFLVCISGNQRCEYMWLQKQTKGFMTVQQPYHSYLNDDMCMHSSPTICTNTKNPP